MHFISKLKIGGKLALGFGVVLLVLIITSVFGIYQLNNNREHFSYFNSDSRQEALVGEIQSNFTLSRIAFIKMLENVDSSQQQVVIERYGKMNSAINDFIGIANDPEIKLKVGDIKSSANNYRDGFVKIMEEGKQLNQIYSWIVDLRGNDTEKTLINIREIAIAGGEYALMKRLNTAHAAFMKARAYEKEFYFMRDDGDLEKHISNYSEFQSSLSNLNYLESVEKYKENYSKLLESKTVYKDNFDYVASKLQEIEKIEGPMDNIGPEISDKIEDIKLALIIKKEQTGNSINKQSNISIASMIILSLFALALGVLIALRIFINIVEPVKSVTSAFKGIAEGEADLGMRIKVQTEDEIGLMAEYFNRFMVKLEEMVTEINENTRLKTGQAEFNELIRGENDLEVLCNKAINYISKRLNAQIGILYVKSGQDNYIKLGTYANVVNDEIKDRVRIGEGLLGQAILEKSMLQIADVPGDYFKISSGSGNLIPKQILILPCLIKDEVQCVFEFASLSEFEELDKKFLVLVGETVAFAISNEEKQGKINELLNATLQQTEELQAQQEELRQSNEELQEQTKALQESEMYLQSQSEELRVTNEELEERGKELEIQQKELFEKNDSLIKSQIEIEHKAEEVEEANRCKSEFLANMSHELRTPLNSILVLSQLLLTETEKYSLNEKQKEFAQTINSSGTELLALINDILDISKVEVGKLEIVKENVSNRELSEYAKRNFTQIANKKGVSLEIKYEEALPETMYTDVLRVKQIIKNLLSNAIKFTEKGSVIFSLERYKREDYESIQDSIGEAIRFRVMDTGIGIARENQSLIFEAFRQSDGTTSRKYGGTGLGLSISKELARLLGGFITMKSELGKGSTFSLVLPLETHSAVATIEVQNDKRDDETTQSPAKESFEDSNGGGYNGTDVEKGEEGKEKNQKTILVIDDDPVFSKVLVEMGEDKNFRCLLAEDGEAGIKMAFEYRPDGIILDIGLPKVDGFKVLDKLKESSRTAQIPIHIISGFDRDNSKIKAEDNVGYIKKPVTLGNLNEIFEGFKKQRIGQIRSFLVVDNKPKQVNSILNILKQKGIDVIATDSFEGAYEILKNKPYDGIVLDYEANNEPAIELLEKLKELQEAPKYIIALIKDEMSPEEIAKIQNYTGNIIVKGPRLKERLLDETSLFLHYVSEGIDADRVYRKENISKEEELFKGKKVLIVDDDMRNVFAVHSILESKGFEIRIGRNGREGIEQFLNNSDIELILLDIMMPEKDGYEVMKEIRNLPNGKNIPIIILTAKAMREERKKCIEAGANDYLTKPLDAEKLLSLLRVWLS